MTMSPAASTIFLWSIPNDLSASGTDSFPAVLELHSVAWCSTVWVPGHMWVGPMLASMSCRATRDVNISAVSVATAFTIWPRSSSASSSSESAPPGAGTGTSMSLWRNRVTPCIVSACTGCATAPRSLVMAASSTTRTRGPMTSARRGPQRPKQAFSAATTGAQRSSFRSWRLSASWMLPNMSLRPSRAASSVVRSTCSRSALQVAASSAPLTTM
mmetsp:Transcript_119212/g.337981  ORF Transcript_119212/g.337981 Transcript_119212/m.337981 type:complete len:215 (+) Transcript_119212:558-1202(+)